MEINIFGKGYKGERIPLRVLKILQGRKWVQVQQVSHLDYLGVGVIKYSDQSIISFDVFQKGEKYLLKRDGGLFYGSGYLEVESK